MSNLICRRGGYRYIYDEDGHVAQVNEINAKMTNITLQTLPDFESAKMAFENGKLKWRETEKTLERCCYRSRLISKHLIRAPARSCRGR